MPESLRGLSRELLAQTETLNPVESKLLEDLSRGVSRMRDDAASKGLTQYRILQEEAQEEGDSASTALYAQEVLKLTRVKHVLNVFDGKLSSRKRE
jgi:hypothetical protein